MNKETKEEKHRKKKARKALLLFHGKLKKTCKLCKKVEELVQFVEQFFNPLIKEFDKEVPDPVKKKFKDVEKWVDSSRSGIDRACDILQKDIHQVIKQLPHGGFGVGGAFGVLAGGALVVGAAATVLSFTAVKIVIKNRGCDPIQPVVYMPVSIPGLSLPYHVIADGGEGVAKLPPITLTVSSEGRQNIRLSAAGVNLSFSLRSSNIDLIFNNQSLLGGETTIDLGKQKQHELIVSCK